MLTTILALIWLHWLADFVLQNDKMAINKSKSFYWLTVHCLIYGCLFNFFGWRFALVNTVAHFVVDGISSRCTTWLWLKGERHWFFVTVGLDQVIHVSILLLTARHFRIL